MSQYEICTCCGKPKRPKQESKRFPANFLLSHTLYCQPNGLRKVKANGHVGFKGDKLKGIYNGGQFQVKDNPVNHADDEGLETVEDWICTPDCPVRLLDEQSGIRKSGGGDKHGRKPSSFCASTDWEQFKGTSTGGDQGGASRYFMRFFYSPKSSKSERNAGCEGLPEKTPEEMTGRKPGSPGLVMAGGKANPYAGTTGEARANHHPTVKPLSLMRYLVRMITPPGGIVLDCFAGSGTTALACIAEGFDYLIIEQEPAYIDIINARVQHALAEVA